MVCPRADAVSETARPLYLVFGGELKHVGSAEFADASRLHFVGAFTDHGEAHRAWSASARATVDDAQMRYFLVDLRKAMNAGPQ